MLQSPFTATRWQVATYLFGVALFSISFLVFLNSSVSFVITDLIGNRKGVGDAVGTLGFADEVVALVACPIWGIVSDRVGVRTVATLGFAIIGVALFLFVQAKNVYPQLLFARLFFSIGGSATATMVTAILPTMMLSPSGDDDLAGHRFGPHGSNHLVMPSTSSELTTTPDRCNLGDRGVQRAGNDVSHDSTFALPERPRPTQASTSQLAGLVGMFTGFGALIAVAIFLPLPERIQKIGVNARQAVEDSYYIVGVIALLVAIFCFIGLQNLPGESGKNATAIFGRFYRISHRGQLESAAKPSYARLLAGAVALSFQDINIGLGYLGGFVARASSVCITLFIPLAVNAFYISTGLCNDDKEESPQDPSEIKRRCRQAYTVAAALTGVSQLVALLTAPIFGYISGKFPRFHLPLLFASAAGVVGYSSFAILPSPDFHKDNGNPAVFLVMTLIGLSQIGAIVCSLGLLGKGVQNEPGPLNNGQSVHPHEDSTIAVTHASPSNHSRPEPPGATEGHVLRIAEEDVSSHSASIQANANETDALLSNGARNGNLQNVTYVVDSKSGFAGHRVGRSELKGSIAGVYSLAGGAGILLLTKVGGALFDDIGHGAPFWMMAVFNALLFVVAICCDFCNEVSKRQTMKRVEGMASGLRGGAL